MTRIGFVGLGLIGARRLQIAQQLGCSIAFAVDPDPSRTCKLPAEVAVASNFADLQPELLEGVQAVFIAVPHDLAQSVCEWAFCLGADVLCEKPLGLSLTQAERIQAAANSQGCKLSAGFNYRFLPGVKSLHGLIQAGVFGEIQRVRINIGHGGRPGMENEWKLKRARAGGGVLIDPGIHLIDLIHHCFGVPSLVDVDLKRRFWNSDVEDNCFLRLRCGTTDVHVDLSLTYWKNMFSIEVYGSDGTALISGRGGNYGAQTLEFVNRWFWYGEDRRVTKDFGVSDHSFLEETAAFLDWVATGKCPAPLSTGADGVNALATVQMIYDRKSA